MESTLEPILASAVADAFGSDFAGVDPLLRPSQFADLQANVAMALAKRVGKPPRDVAAAIVEHLPVGDESAVASVEVSGPGFLNLTVNRGWIAGQVMAQAADPRLGVPQQEPLVIPIDYSAPNVAKEMHAGHLRTTIVGDALARTLEMLGHKVVRQNHIGDWGTPFGMLIEHLLEVGEDSDEAREVVNNPNAFYQAARAKFDGDADFAKRARARVVALQAGDPETLGHWNDLIALSKAYFNKVYTALNVTLTDEDLAGESTYNDELAGICDELEEQGLATVDDGALCVFLDGVKGRDDKPLPLIIRKSDGGYGYGTTDLATVRHRVRTMGANRILYVVGATQALHFTMVWETARKAGWVPDDVQVVHVKIGNVLGEDRKILRTRSGAPLRLMALVDEACDKARATLNEARPDMPEEQRETIAPMIGAAAIKFADLSVAHDSEYVFDLDRMVSFQGATGPYLQYAAARVRSILRRAEISEQDALSGTVTAEHDAEAALAQALLGFGGVVQLVGDSLEPHRLCTYLFDLAQTFSTFYEQCPVLKADTEELRASRLALSALTLRVIVTGLDLLGIETPQEM